MLKSAFDQHEICLETVTVLLFRVVLVVFSFFMSRIGKNTLFLPPLMWCTQEEVKRMDGLRLQALE